MLDRTNILFITHYSGMYGANQSLCTLVLELRDKYNVHPIVLLPCKGDFYNLLEQNKITCYVSHFYWWVNADKGLFQRLLNYRKQMRNLLRGPKLLKIIKKEEIDLVYSNSVTINIGVFLSSKLHCPHIWHIRETLQAYNFQFSIADFLVKKIFASGADKYIVISDFIAASYSDFLPREKVQKIYNGVSNNRDLLQTNEEQGILNLCMLGLVCAQKNQLDAIKAVKLLSKEKGIQHIKLHIVGAAKEDYLQEVKAYIEDNALQDKVILHGHQSDIQSILCNMHIGLMCARDEAFGRVSIEYMLHHMPVIASRSGANAELVKEGISGTLYELNNIEVLAAKIETFIENPHLQTTMGESAYEYAKNNFSSEQTTAAIYSLIEALLKNNLHQF